MAFLDARALDQDAVIDSDLCIIGSGAAGIALAHEFIGQPWRVAVLAGGGFELGRRAQLLYHGENIGRENFATARSRLRMFGGSTTRWTGQCRPFDPLDFETRPGVPLSGWPFDRAHLEPFYRRAHDFCHLGDYGYQPDLKDAPALRQLSDGGGELAPVLFRFSHPTDLGAVYRPALAAAADVRVYLHAHAVEIELEPAARRVVAVRAATFEGRRIRFVARAIVLACGGIENPRLLLASNRVAGRGIGNAHDLVGRYFMDHPLFWAGCVEPADPAADDGFDPVDYARAGAAQRCHAALTLAAPVRRAEGLNGAVAFMVRRARHKSSPAYLSRGGTSLIHLVDILTGRALPDGRLVRHLGQAAAGGRDGISVVGQHLRAWARKESVLAVRFMVETTPEPTSRVTLGARRDRFDMPRVRVDWRLRAEDRRGVERLLQAIRGALVAQGVGRLVEPQAVDAAGWPIAMTGGRHHMGTTRMAADPRQGVVDPACRVHQVANLFVAGSSVFPTSGYVNPTLTIVALALRLADHLKTRLHAGLTS
jgi:choline dehydrogenase-like flavoprotein